jgi:phytoene synthase
MQGDFTHCAALVRRADRDRYLATLFAPPEHRNALFALYAFNCEIARVREAAREPMPGEIRLQWWREALAGTRESEATAHPVAAALRDTLARYRLSPEPLAALIDARAFDLYDEPMASFDELTDYGTRTEGAVFGLACAILGAGGQMAGPLVMNAASASIIAGVLDSLARRQLFLPADLLREHGIGREMIVAEEASGQLSAALAQLRTRARGHLELAAAQPVPAQIVPALLPAALIGPTLRCQERASNPVHVTPLPPWRRQWLIWRAARDPRRIFRA